MNKLTTPFRFVVLLFFIAVSGCAPATPSPSTVAAITPLPADSMVLIPAGAFTMGNSVDQAMAACQKDRPDCERIWFAAEEPAHSVDVAAFYMDVYEVTNGAYKTCVDAGKCAPPRLKESRTHPTYYGDAQYASFPVINVNWENAKTYCEWRGARLPTEAEWEKAARGTDGRIYPWGNDADKTYANYKSDDLVDPNLGDPVAVGSYESGKSPYGLYDMAGNVWEWVSDWYDVYPGGDPQASPDFGQKARGLRGGGWLDPSNSLRATYRGALDPTQSFGNIGFRCARDGE